MYKKSEQRVFTVDSWVLTTFQLGQGYVKTDTIDFQIIRLFKIRIKKTPSLNKNTIKIIETTTNIKKGW